MNDKNLNIIIGEISNNSLLIIEDSVIDVSILNQSLNSNWKVGKQRKFGNAILHNVYLNLSGNISVIEIENRVCKCFDAFAKITKDTGVKFAITPVRKKSLWDDINNMDEEILLLHLNIK